MTASSADDVPVSRLDLRHASAPSPALGGSIEYLLYQPEVGGDLRFPVVYLLHGRGGSMTDVRPALARIDRSIRDRLVPPFLVVAPDAPWSNRSSWYVDSRFSGSPPGRPIETALVRDLVDHIDASHPTIADRSGRIAAGVSMGGAGALRFALAHPDRFAAAVCLSPAIYDPLPPSDSSIRGSVAFGRDRVPFDPSTYEALSYRRLLASFGRQHPVRLWIGVSNREMPPSDPTATGHGLDHQAAALFLAARAVPGIDASLLVVEGGHDWPTWSAMLETAILDVLGRGTTRGVEP